VEVVVEFLRQAVVVLVVGGGWGCVLLGCCWAVEW
jgi:hypothetical protein